MVVLVVSLKKHNAQHTPGNGGRGGGGGEIEDRFFLL